MTAPLCPLCAEPLPPGGGMCGRCLMAGFLAHEEAETLNLQGVTFGDYELLGQIASGGMGVVYKARHLSLHRTVALKMMKAGRLADAMERRRFTTEAEAVARLEHPNIVPVYEVGECEEQPFYTMRLIQGGRSGLDMKDADLRTAAGTLEAVARAVHFAHQRGILHRDLKPANILLDADGTPFVADFGLAKFMETDSSLTVSGAVLGTPAYMAPEVAAGGARAATVAADVYSLGSLLYEWLTGRPPFHAPTTLELLRRIGTDTPASPSSVNGNVPRDLATVVLKCLEKAPEKRYATAGALAEDVERWLRGESISARPVSSVERLWRGCRRKPALAALLAVSAAGAAALVLQTQISNRRLARESESSRTQAWLAREAESRALESSREAQRSAYISNLLAASRARLAGEYTPARRILDEQPEDQRGLEWSVLKAVLTEPPPVLDIQAAGAVTSLAFTPDYRFLIGVDARGAHAWDLADGCRVDGILPPGDWRTDCTQVAAPEGKWRSEDKRRYLLDGEKWFAFATRQHGTLVWRYVSGMHDLFGAAVGRAPVPRVEPAADGALLLPQDAAVKPAWEQLAELPGKSPQLCAAMDGTRLLLRTASGAGALYNTADWKALAAFSLPGPAIALSADGARLATMNSDKAMLVLDAQNGRELCRLEGGAGAAAFSRSMPPGDGNLPREFISYSDWGSRLRLADAASGYALSVLSREGNGDGITALAWLDDSALAAGSANHAVRVWGNDGIAMGSANDHAATVTALAWHRPANMLASAAADGRIVLRDVFYESKQWFRGLAESTAAPAKEADGKMPPAFYPPVLALPGSSQCLLHREDGSLVLCDAAAGRVLRDIPRPDGEELAAPVTGAHLFFVRHHKPGALASFIEVNSRSAPEALRSRAGLVEEWRLIALDPQTGRPAREVVLEGLKSAPLKISAASSGGKVIALLAAPRSIAVWDGFTGKRLALFSTEADVKEIHCAPDGSQIITGTTESWTARALPGGEVQWKLPRSFADVVRFLPDAAFKQAAVSLTDGTIGLYRLSDGTRAAVLSGHTSPARGLAWSPDGERLFSTTSMGDVRIWHVPAGRELVTLGRDAGLTNELFVTGDGRHLLLHAWGSISVAP